MSRFAKFLLIGALATGIQYLILIVLTAYFAVVPWLASSIGFAASSVLNYSLNYLVTFRSRERHLVSGTRFAVMAASGLALTAVLMKVLTAATHAYLICQVVTTALVLLVNYTVARLWVFSRA